MRFPAPPPQAVTTPRPEPRPFFPLDRPEPRRHHPAGLRASLRSRRSRIPNAIFLVVSSATVTFSNHERPHGLNVAMQHPLCRLQLAVFLSFQLEFAFFFLGGKTSAIFKTEDNAVIVRSFVRSESDSTPQRGSIRRDPFPILETKAPCRL